MPASTGKPQWLQFSGCDDMRRAPERMSFRRKAALYRRLRAGFVDLRQKGSWRRPYDRNRSIPVARASGDRMTHRPTERRNAMYTNLLLATDGSKLSDKAAAHAIGLASKIGARLNCLYVAPDYPEPMYLDGGSLNNLSRGDYEAATEVA